MKGKKQYWFMIVGYYSDNNQTYVGDFKAETAIEAAETFKRSLPFHSPRYCRDLPNGAEGISEACIELRFSRARELL